MRFSGFVGPSYTLDSVNVDCQRCVNLYPGLIESGTGKGGQRYYLRPTPGLRKILEVGDGPIRLIHTDSIGRVFVVSGNQLFQIKKGSGWGVVPVYYSSVTVPDQETGINTGTDVLTSFLHQMYTGLKVRVASNNTLPTGLSAGTDYWVIVDSANTYRLASSLANALAGTQVNITATGTGTLTLTPQLPAIVESVAVDSAADTFTKTAHGLYTGLKVRICTLTQTSGGLNSTTDYFVIVVNADTFKLATSLANAVAGTAIDVTAVSGDWTITLINQMGYVGPAFTFDTAFGAMRAASMSFLGNGDDSSTVFVDGTDNYAFWQTGASTHSVGKLSSGGYGDVKTADDIVWSDGSFIVNEAGTNRFYVSDVQSFNIDSLTFTSSDGSPDILLALAVNNRILWAFNEKTIELYANTGNADFPYERIPGGYLEIGLAAKRSVAKAGGSLFWLARSEKGRGIVCAASGTTPQRISTHAIECAISSYADITTATAFAYESNGHAFYVLNFTEATWVYDLSTDLWHERAYTNSGNLERHRAETHAYSSTYDAQIVGDHSNAKVYVLDDSYYSDDGTEITRMRTFPHFSAEDLRRVFCSRFQLDMQTGVGLDGGGVGSDPQVMLDWSDDHGNTWSDEMWTSAGGKVGGIGDFNKRVIWRRLGSFYDRVFRVKITDPVKVVFIDAWLDIRMGGR